MAYWTVVPFELRYICYLFLIRLGCIKITLQNVFCCSFWCGFPIFLRLFTDDRMHVNGLHDPMDPVLAEASPVKAVDPCSHPAVPQDVVIVFVVLSD